MKKVVYTKYGPPDVLELRDVDMPVPQADEILIKVHATTATPADWRIRKPDPFLARLDNGLLRPKKITVLGTELAGEVVATGQDVTRFQTGDQVFASTYDLGYGAYAEFICLPEDAPVALKPANISFEEAAAIPMGGHTALHFIRDVAKVTQGTKLLIIGASGSNGTYAVQIAKHLGANVTAVCSSANVELMRVLGADSVIDYTKENYTNNGQVYDVIFDAVSKSSYAKCKHSLTENGIYMQTLPGLLILLQMFWTGLFSRKKAVYSTAPDHLEALQYLKSLIEKGGVKPIIDKCYPMKNVAEAHAYVEKGHKVGNVVITILHT